MFCILMVGFYKSYDDVFIKEIGKCICVYSDVFIDFIWVIGKEESYEVMSRVYKDRIGFFYGKIKKYIF